MLKSMTGYGRGQASGAGYELQVEVKSVNHRYLEVTAKMPKQFAFLEDALKKQVQSVLRRGKVEVSLSVQADAGQNLEVTVNREAAGAYLTALREMSGELGLEDDLRLSHLLQFPEVFTVRKAELDEEDAARAVRAAAESALASHDEMRCQEGRKLAEDLEEKLGRVEELVSRVEERSPLLQKMYYDRLYQKLAEVLQDTAVEESRLVTEAAVFADKVAVDEETVRLRSHIQQFRSFLRSEEPVGKRMDFLVQEMNRETNTIGFKAQDLEIARMVVELKSEIEKIREQIQNIE